MLFKNERWQFLSEYSDNVPVLRCSGLTKKCSVPGWRIGWLALIGKPGVFDQVKQALKQWTNIILMPNTICQAGLNEIYDMSNKTIDQTMEALQLRADTFRKGMEGTPGVQVGQTK